MSLGMFGKQSTPLVAPETWMVILILSKRYVSRVLVRIPKMSLLARTIHMVLRSGSFGRKST